MPSKWRKEVFDNLGSSRTADLEPIWLAVKTELLSWKFAQRARRHEANFSLNWPFAIPHYRWLPVGLTYKAAGRMVCAAALVETQIELDKEIGDQSSEQRATEHLKTGSHKDAKRPRSFHVSLVGYHTRVNQLVMPWSSSRLRSRPIVCNPRHHNASALFG